MGNAQLRRPVSVFLLVLCLATFAYQVFLIQRDQAGWENPLAEFGSRDLIAFWAGAQVFSAGEDPYQSQNTLAVQQSVNQSTDEAQVFLNPPWSLAIFHPLFSGKFVYTRILWIALNILFLIGICAFLRYELQPPARSTLPACAVALLFFPTIQTLWMGQLSLMVTFSLVLFVFSIKRRRFALAALCALPLTLKPHILLPFGVLILIRTARHREWILPILIIPVFLVAALYPVFSQPEIYLRWQAMDFSPLDYRTATLSTQARSLLFAVTGEASRWPAFFLPFLACTTTAWWASRQKEISLEWPMLSCILAISLLFAPYTWPYDFVLLLPAQVFPLLQLKQADASQKAQFRLLLILLALQGAYVVEGMLTDDLGATFWFPAAMMLPVVYARSVIGREKKEI